jgi:hypothetical protein
MGRSRQVRADTQPLLGPEAVGWDQDRWGGTGSGGVGREAVGWDKQLPVSAHHDLFQVTRLAPQRVLGLGSAPSRARAKAQAEAALEALGLDS